MWWTIRRWWHRPSMMHKCYPPLFQEGWWLLRDWKRYRWWKGLYWKLRWWFPLHCTGRHGWRTDLCEWFEDQARKGDD